MLKVYLQEACLRHQFIRSKDTSNIVERPERLRAVDIGVATVLARTADSLIKPVATPAPLATKAKDADDLADAIGRLDIAQAGSSTLRTSAVHVVKSSAKVNILNHAAVKYIHGDIEGNVYLEKLVKLAKESKEKIAAGESEIPDGLSQGDLYRKFESDHSIASRLTLQLVCPESVNAIQGALGTTCEAVEEVLDPSSSAPTAFVVVRPPGHHCGEVRLQAASLP